MAQKAIRSFKLTDTLTLSECKNGWWLYDETQGMNLAMKAKTEREAFVDAISYYQRRQEESKEYYKKTSEAINLFITSVNNNDDEL